MKEDRRYMMCEIETATGIKASTLQNRRKRLGIPANGLGYTLDEVKQMIKRPKRRNPDKQYADDLRKKLLNDGAL